MKIEEKDRIKPKCPHCERVVDNLVKVIHGHVERHNIYCCPHCQKILGVGVSRS